MFRMECLSLVKRFLNDAIAAQDKMRGLKGGWWGERAGARESSAVRLAGALSECIQSGCSPPAPPRALLGGAAEASPAGPGANPGRPPAKAEKREAWQAWPGPVVLVATAASAEDLPGPLRRCFTHEIAVEAPDEHLRLSLLEGMLRDAAGPDLLQSELPVRCPLCVCPCHVMGGGSGRLRSELCFEGGSVMTARCCSSCCGAAEPQDILVGPDGCEINILF